MKIEGIGRLINRLEKVESSLDSQNKLFLTRLAGMGIDTARVAFGTAQYDGNNDVVVHTPEWAGESTIIIRATGKSVTFIEFGTGVTNFAQHPMAIKMGAYRGLYGAQKGSNPKGWSYYGVAGTNGELVRASPEGNVYRTHGNPPARAMYLADKEIRNNIVSVAKEIFT